jgi:hypothetical protein
MKKSIGCWPTAIHRPWCNTEKGYNINVKKYSQNIQGLWNSSVLGNGFLSICDVAKVATIHKLI